MPPGVPDLPHLGLLAPGLDLGLRVPARLVKYYVVREPTKSTPTRLLGKEASPALTLVRVAPLLFAAPPFDTFSITTTSVYCQDGI